VHYRIQGPARLAGRFRPSGNKNGALPILAACLLTDEPVVLDNVPEIRDVFTMIELIQQLGATVEHVSDNTFRIDAADVNTGSVDPDLSRRGHPRYGRRVFAYRRVQRLYPRLPLFQKKESIHANGHDAPGPRLRGMQPARAWNSSTVRPHDQNAPPTHYRYPPTPGKYRPRVARTMQERHQGCPLLSPA